MVLLNDFKRQWESTASDLERAFRRVGSSGYYVLGPEVARFEKDLASFWGLPHAVGVANGMDAIEIALRAGGLERGSLVLTTPLTAFATSLAILRAGGIPVFCDVDHNGLMDLEAARQILASEPGIKALVPVHLYGQCMDLEKLSALKREFSVLVVEDCAQSIGSKWSGSSCGSVGDFAATSFYPTKNLGCMGDGGAILSTKLEGAEMARCLRHYGQRQRYEHVELGLNSRLDELQAALLSEALLPRLSEWTEFRRSVASKYLSRIRHEGLRTLSPPSQCASVWHLFPVFVLDPTRRNSLEEHLKTSGVQTGCHYPILVQAQQAYLSAVDKPQSVSNTPSALALAQTELSLPIHPFLTGGEIERVIHAVNSWSG